MTARKHTMTAPHTIATDADVVDALVSYLRECRAVSYHHASTLIVRRLIATYGEKLVRKAAERYGRELRRERRYLDRQAAQMRADNRGAGRRKERA
jgi:hypothetical protein